MRENGVERRYIGSLRGGNPGRHRNRVTPGYARAGSGGRGQTSATPDVPSALKLVRRGLAADETRQRRAPADAQPLLTYGRATCTAISASPLLLVSRTGSHLSGRRGVLIGCCSEAVADRSGSDGQVAAWATKQHRRAAGLGPRRALGFTRKESAAEISGLLLAPVSARLPHQPTRGFNRPGRESA